MLQIDGTVAELSKEKPRMKHDATQTLLTVTTDEGAEGYSVAGVGSGHRLRLHRGQRDLGTWDTCVSEAPRDA